jgi:ankyrin repeat protein
MGLNLKILTVAGMLSMVVAIIVLVGLAVLDGFSNNLRDLTGTTALNIAAQNGSIAGNVTYIGAVGVYPFLQTVPICVNESDAGMNITFAGSDYTITPGTVRERGSILITSTDANATALIAAEEDMNCTITYLGTSTAQQTADLFIAGLTIFGTFMAVIVLALIGKVIVGFFAKGKR